MLRFMLVQFLIFFSWQETAEKHDAHGKQNLVGAMWTHFPMPRHNSVQPIHLLKEKEHR